MKLQLIYLQSVLQLFQLVSRSYLRILAVDKLRINYDFKVEITKNEISSLMKTLISTLLNSSVVKNGCKLITLSTVT